MSDDDFDGYGGTYAFQQARNDDERRSLLDILRGNYPQQVGFPMIPGASGQVGYGAQVGFPMNPAPPPRLRAPRSRRNRLLDYFDLLGMDGQW